MEAKENIEGLECFTFTFTFTFCPPKIQLSKDCFALVRLCEDSSEERDRKSKL